MRLLFGFIFCVAVIPAWSQSKEDEQKTFFGLEYRPIFNSEFLTSGATTTSGNNLNYEIQNVSGRSLGMVIRHNFYKNFSVETGISGVARNYSFTAEDDTSSFAVSDGFRFVAYDLPLTGLVQVQAGRNIYINAGPGLVFSFFPTETGIFEQDYEHVSLRRGWVRMAFTAQLGAEYRTEQSGIFYLGASFFQPFSEIANSEFTQVIQTRVNRKLEAPLQGRFLTLSFRYFFADN